MTLDWMRDAACKDATTDGFFPERGGSFRYALSFCDVCTVKAECLQYALDGGIKDGIYGGLGERGRRRYARRSRRCEQCNTVFEIERTKERPRYCSEPCRRRARCATQAATRQRAKQRVS